MPTCHLPFSCYQRLIPPPWMWRERLLTPDPEEAGYPRTIQQRFQRVYAQLAEIETRLWYGHSLASRSAQESGYLTSLYYGYEAQVTVLPLNTVPSGRCAVPRFSS